MLLVWVQQCLKEYVFVNNNYLYQRKRGQKTIMFLPIGCLIIICAATIAIVKSKKPLRLILAEAKSEVLFNAMGLKYMMLDFVMRKKNKTDLPLKTGKTAVITGGTRGIGMEVIKLLLKCDINVIIGCRNVQQGEALLSKFRQEGITTGNLEVCQLDISALESVKKFAKEVRNNHNQIDYLINNAGILYGPYQETPDGYELQFATNYLGHFLLTHLLLPELKNAGSEASQSRIVNVSSCAHVLGKINFPDINFRKLYVPGESYAQSKLGQILFTNHLNSLLIREKEYVQVHSVNPGVTNTDIFINTTWNKIPWRKMLFKSPQQAALSVIYACLSADLEGKGGTYIMDCAVFPTSRQAQDPMLQKEFFEFSKQLIHADIFSRLT